MRGKLCTSCNSLLGRAKDNPEILTRALAYLLHWKRVHEDLEVEERLIREVKRRVRLGLIGCDDCPKREGPL